MSDTPPASETTPVTVSHGDAQRRVLHRLRRARGQLDAVIRAVESDASCRDVITQLAAVTHALNRAGYTIVSTAMTECLTDPDTDLNRDELEKIFLTLA